MENRNVSCNLYTCVMKTFACPSHPASFNSSAFHFLSVVKMCSRVEHVMFLLSSLILSLSDRIPPLSDFPAVRGLQEVRRPVEFHDVMQCRGVSAWPLDYFGVVGLSGTVQGIYNSPTVLNTMCTCIPRHSSFSNRFFLFPQLSLR